MRIDRNLNLVLPIDTDTGTIYVHSMPISREVFEKYYRVISKVFAQIIAEGFAYSLAAGPRVASVMLRETAKELGQWDGPDGVENGLMAEIRRLSNVVMPTTEGGWSTIPFQEAITRKLLDPEDIMEAEGAIVFFTCNSSMHRRDQLKDILDGMVRLWDAQIISLNSSAFCNSLPISTVTDSSGETAPISSVPS